MKIKCAFGKKPDIGEYEDNHSCLRHYTCRSCHQVHVRKGQ